MAEVKSIGDKEYPSQNSLTRSTLQPVEKTEAKDKPRLAAMASNVKKKKRSRLKEAFFGEHVDNIGEYILYDVAIPALKATMEDMFGQGLHMLFYGETKKKKDSTGRVSYGSYFNRGSRRDDDRPTRREANNVDDILFDSERTANDVLDELMNRAEEYDVATVLDLYDLAGVTGSSYMDDNYGWFMRDLRSARVRRVYDRRDIYYSIDLPRPVRVV